MLRFTPFVKIKKEESLAEFRRRSGEIKLNRFLSGHVPDKKHFLRSARRALCRLQAAKGEARSGAKSFIFVGGFAAHKNKAGQNVRPLNRHY